MSANYKEVVRQLPKEERQRYATDIALVGNFVDSLQNLALLPKRFAKAVEPSTAQAGATETSQPRGLEPIRFAIEIPAVSEELYKRTREAVEQSGYNFIVPIRSVSMQDILAEDKLREQKGAVRRLGYVNDSKIMRATVPPEMEVAINPKRFKIEESNSLSTDKQKTLIKAEEARLRRQLPEDVRDFIKMVMVDPSTLSQLEDAYMDGTGELLYPNFFARTDVQTVRGNVARVGRHDPTGRRYVYVWYRDDGNAYVFAVSVVVLPRKLVA